MKLFVRVKPGKKKEGVAFNNNLWNISINAPAKDGKANARLVEFLSGILEIPKSKIVIDKGHAAPFKVLEISAEEKAVVEKLRKKL
jgi:uncharacterized protein